jgi:hypothetical protein
MGKTEINPLSQLVDRAKLYANAGDGDWGIYETPENAKRLPYSVFYEGENTLDPMDGLFNYYFPNKSVFDGNQFLFYSQSELRKNLDYLFPYESRNPTARQIIDTIMKEKNGPPGYLDKNSVYRGQPYNVKDFIFCKDYGIVPNNRMITLRRFPHPVEDHLVIHTDTNFKIETERISMEKAESNKVLAHQLIDGIGQPLAQCVGYFGPGTDNTSLNSIIGFSNGLKWVEEEQSDKPQEIQGNDPGIMNSIFANMFESVLGAEGKAFFSSASDMIGNLGTPEKAQFAFQRAIFEKLYSSSGPLGKKIFVDVNSVKKMWRREVGFTGDDKNITLNFSYNLSSVGERNSRMLFMDLLGNLLSIGTDYGKFLAPEMRHNPSTQGLPFPGGAKGHVEFLTSPIEYIINLIAGSQNSNLSQTLDRAAQNLKEIQKSLGSLNAENLGTFLKNMKKDDISYKILENYLRTQQLEKIVFKPMMLTGAPTGSWHLVVGNPLNPIAMMGNLICTGVSISFGETLGPDDFPTEMKATYTLKPARERHRGDFESMFNRGRGRFYLGALKSQGESKGFQTDIDGNRPESFYGTDPNTLIDAANKFANTAEFKEDGNFRTQ